GDPLVWHWDFGDGTSSTAAAIATKSWRRTGDFLVAVEVSDMRGGTARAHLPIRVGSPNTFRVSGRILTGDGLPVAAARVHNGVIDAGTCQNRHLAAFTDANGNYTLIGVPPGHYPIAAYLFGYAIGRRAPITVTGHDLVNIGFVATALPRIFVT